MGSTRFRQTPWAAVREMGVLPGSFATNGTSAVAASTVKGDGFTVSRTDVGTFKVTYDKTYPQTLSVVATLQAATGQALTIEADDVATTSFVLRLTAAAGTATDLAAATQNRINFCAYVKNTGTS